MPMSLIYLDYAATTPLDLRVEDAMRPYARGVFGNPSSLHTAGRQARAAVDDARETVAACLGARPAEILFTSGGTEANNLALFGVARALRARGTHIITTAIEHHALLAPCHALEREGFRVTYLAPDHDGVIAPERVADAITPETSLVSVMYANNETGVIQPVAEIARHCRAQGVLCHTDAVQAAGALPLRVEDLPVDLLSLSAHKLYGPKGVGALYVRAGTRLQPLLYGGGQEYERRAGTENVAGVVGFATALALAGEEETIPRLRHLRDRLEAAVLTLPGSRRHGACDRRLATHLNVGFTGIPAEMLVMALDLEGIAISAGAACSAGAAEPSHVIRALGYDRIAAQEAVRFSLGRFTTDEEIEQVIAVMARVIPRLRGEVAPTVMPSG